MKKINFIKITSLILLIALSACNKEECGYDQNLDACVPTKPEGFMVGTNTEYNGNGVGVIYETTFNAISPIGADWNDLALPPASKVVSIYPTNWKTNIIGNVFGIALDNVGNIYLSATDTYAMDGGVGTPSTFGATGGRCGIYKTNLSTPGTTSTLVSTFTGNAWNYVLANKIPNSGIGLGNSLGNLAYDKVHNQLFVSNLEDGRIYRLDATTGNVKSVFDPFTLDSPSNGIVAVREQIWGVGVLTKSGTTEVYFARSETGFNTIWSIKLNAAGEFIATPQLGQPNVFNDSASSSVNHIQKIGTQNKISDIEFSCSGKMLIAERGGAHSSMIFEYQKVGTSWIPTVPLFLGGFTGNNSAGGVDYGARETSIGFVSDDIIWGSLNYGQPANSSGLVYGVEGISSTGNTIATNSATDLYIDRNSGVYDKGGIGDVDVFDSSCPCNN